MLSAEILSVPFCRYSIPSVNQPPFLFTSVIQFLLFSLHLYPFYLCNCFSRISYSHSSLWFYHTQLVVIINCEALLISLLMLQFSFLFIIALFLITQFCFVFWALFAPWSLLMTVARDLSACISKPSVRRLASVLITFTWCYYLLPLCRFDCFILSYWLCCWLSSVSVVFQCPSLVLRDEPGDELALLHSFSFCFQDRMVDMSAYVPFVRIFMRSNTENQKVNRCTSLH